MLTKERIVLKGECGVMWFLKLLALGAGSKSRSVESEENHPSPWALVGPTDWTRQADLSLVLSLFLPYCKNGNHGQVGHKAYKIKYQNSSSVGSRGAL